MTNSYINVLVHYLTDNESEYVYTVKSTKRRNSYIFGRYSMKVACSLFCNEKLLTNIEISNGVFGYPIINVNGQSNISGSISHCDTYAAALVYPENIIMGIDIENINRVIKNTVIRSSNKHELSAIYELECVDEVKYHIIWTARESLSKCLRTGFTIAPEVLEIESIVLKSGYFEVAYKNFPHFKANSYLINDTVCTITYPKKLDISLNLESHR